MKKGGGETYQNAEMIRRSNDDNPYGTRGYDKGYDEIQNKAACCKTKLIFYFCTLIYVRNGTYNYILLYNLKMYSDYLLGHFCFRILQSEHFQ